MTKKTTKKTIIAKLRALKNLNQLGLDISYVMSLDYSKTAYMISDKEWREKAINDVAEFVSKSEHIDTYLKELKIN